MTNTTTATDLLHSALKLLNDKPSFSTRDRSINSYKLAALIEKHLSANTPPATPEVDRVMKRYEVFATETNNHSVFVCAVDEAHAQKLADKQFSETIQGSYEITDCMLDP